MRSSKALSLIVFYCVILMVVSLFGVVGTNDVALADSGGVEPPIMDSIPDINSNSDSTSSDMIIEPDEENSLLWDIIIATFRIL